MNAIPPLRAICDKAIREIAELPDRTSPDDHPQMMLVSAEELHPILWQSFLSAYWMGIEDSKDFDRRMAENRIQET